MSLVFAGGRNHTVEAEEERQHEQKDELIMNEGIINQSVTFP
jgi:hypothetical protein